LENKKVNKDIIEKQERLRAQYIIEKAKRDGESVVSSLVSHMVNKNLIEELTGVLPELERKVKVDKTKELKEWVSKNLSKELGTKQIAESLDCSYDTAIKTIRENPFYFVSVRRGYYEIRDGDTEREQAKKDK
jgi:hypothetical protein